MDDIEDFIARTIQDYNNAPVKDFSGLSPSQMFGLIYEPLGPNSAVAFAPTIPDSALDQMPFFRLAEAFLKIVQREGSLKMTATGALPRKIVFELYEMKILPDLVIEKGITKLAKETDVISMLSVRYTCELAGAVKVIKGKLTMTKKGENWTKPENRSDLFKALFTAATTRLNWAIHDAYPPRAVQDGFLFSIFLLMRAAPGVKTSEDFFPAYLAAFKPTLELFDADWFTPEKNFRSCYNVRFFLRFADWWGFIDYVNPNKLGFDPEPFTVNTKLLKSIFTPLRKNA